MLVGKLGPESRFEFPALAAYPSGKLRQPEFSGSGGGHRVNTEQRREVEVADFAFVFGIDSAAHE